MYLPCLFFLIQTSAYANLILLYVSILACSFCISFWNGLYNIPCAITLYHISSLCIVLIASTFCNACLYVSNCSAVDSAVVVNINFFSEIDFDTVAILTSSDVWINTWLILFLSSTALSVLLCKVSYNSTTTLLAL